MLKSVVATIKDCCKVVYEAIKNVVKFFHLLGVGIYTFFKYIFAVIKGFFVFIKSVVDFFYKLVFMAFVCVVGFAIYKIYHNASDINKKLDNVVSGIQSILNFTDKSNNLLNKIDSMSLFSKNNSKDAVAVDKDKNVEVVGKENNNANQHDNGNTTQSDKKDVVKGEKGTNIDNANKSDNVVSGSTGDTNVKPDDKAKNSSKGVKKYLADKWKTFHAWLKK